MIARQRSVRERWAALLGDKALYERMEVICGINRTTYYRWGEDESAWPKPVTLLLSFLERVPEGDWPRNVRALVKEARAI